MESIEREIALLETSAGKCPFEQWYTGIRDEKFRQSILVKITRLQSSAYNDYQAVGAGVFELRIFKGPGFRIYFGFERQWIVLLLCGGDKDSQAADLERAKRLWRAYSHESEENRRKRPF